jgi:hypothetical protein
MTPDLIQRPPKQDTGQIEQHVLRYLYQIHVDEDQANTCSAHRDHEASSHA